MLSRTRAGIPVPLPCVDGVGRVGTCDDEGGRVGARRHGEDGRVGSDFDPGTERTSALELSGLRQGEGSGLVLGRGRRGRLQEVRLTGVLRDAVRTRLGLGPRTLTRDLGGVLVCGGAPVPGLPGGLRTDLLAELRTGLASGPCGGFGGPAGVTLGCAALRSGPVVGRRRGVAVLPQFQQ